MEELLEDRVEEEGLFGDHVAAFGIALARRPDRRGQGGILRFLFRLSRTCRWVTRCPGTLLGGCLLSRARVRRRFQSAAAAASGQSKNKKTRNHQGTGQGHTGKHRKLRNVAAP